MLFRLRFLLVAIAGVAGLKIAAAAEGEMPKFDMTAACQGSSSAQAAKCMHREQTARDQLARLWAQSTELNASRCIQRTGQAGTATYTELLTCLQAVEADPLGPHQAIAR